MKNLINILGILLFVFLIISCGNESTNDNQQVNQLVKENTNNIQIIETLKKKSLFYAKAEEFEYLTDKNSEFLNITKIVFSFIMPTNADSPIICKEVLKFIGEEKVVFSSSEEYALIEEEELREYRMMQKGTIEINDNTYSGTLYYNDRSNDNKVGFDGKLIFELPAIKSLEGESVTIEIKGKQ